MSSSEIVQTSTGAVTGFKHPIPVATTDFVPGYTVVHAIGVVRGNSIRARHIGRDIMAGLRSIVGGEIREYTKMMAESREQAIDRMIDQARGLGADAIINVRFTTSAVMAGAAELLAYGTAVNLRPNEN